MKKCLFIANNTFSTQGLSGGDRIWVEFCRNWQKRINITLLGPTSSLLLLKKYDPKTNIDLLCTSRKIIHLKNDTFSLGFLFLHYLKRVFSAIKLIYKKLNFISQFNYVYSTSDFYPDFIPGLFIKLTHPKIIWIAGFYLLAPPPFSRQSPYTGLKRFKGLLYYLMQIPSLFFIKRFADYVFITSEPDVKLFISSRIPRSKIIVVQGGVDTQPSKKYLTKHIIEPKKYDALFIGRLHPQKGILRLMDIWHIVAKRFPKAQLVIIGNGYLLSELKEKITRLKLEKNITLKGFADGNDKFNIFKESKIVLHPATYDSGGMASAEAMAWGLPGISFDLESLKTYYPQGMIKIPCFDNNKFADNIITLLTNNKIYQKYSKDAIELINLHWSWISRCDQIFNTVFPIHHDN